MGDQKMKRRFYTIWKSKKDDKEALLLEDEKFFYTKCRAFKRAEVLAKQLISGWDYVILVRRIVIGDDICQEWVFEAK